MYCGLGIPRKAKLEPDQSKEPVKPDNPSCFADPMNRKHDLQRHRKQCDEKRQQQPEG